MAELDLLFASDDRGPLDLVFGDDGDAEVQQSTLHAAGQVTGLRGAAGVRTLALAHAGGQLTGLRGHVGVAHDINVARPLLARVLSAFQVARPLLAVSQGRWQDSARLSVATRTVWQVAQPLAGVHRTHAQASIALRAGVRSHWQVGLPLLHQARGHFQQAIALRAGARAGWQLGLPLLHSVRGRFQQAISLRAGVRAHWQVGLPLLAGGRGRLRAGLPISRLHRPHFQVARYPLPGRTQRPPPEPPEPCYAPEQPIELLFALPEDWSLGLVFACDVHGGTELPPAGIVVLPRRSYIVINSVEIRRADSAELLPSEAFSMTLDRDSWTWSFTATFERQARDAVAPGVGAPVELEVKVNGQPFRLLAERIGRSVRFPERLVKVSGRGKAALLDAPHAPVQSFGNVAARTAQQLMGDVLTINGVGMGWTVDWQLTDWLVPAGAWLHSGTWSSALNDIAGAVGGYLQPHDTAATLRVLPSWPAPWWEWDSVTPDLELPAGIAEVENTEWIDKPAYNRVFVAGEATGGVEGDYKRAGTAGDVLRQPMIVHPLITAEAAARQRAIAELSDSGRLINQSLTLMVLTETGVIKPGTLLRYTDDDGAARLGIVRSTLINPAFPVLTQTIGVESHA